MWYFKTVAKFGFEWVKTGIYVPESKNDRCFQKKNRFGGGGVRMCRQEQKWSCLRKPEATREPECVWFSVSMHLDSVI